MDGTTIENGEAGLAQGFLWLWFSGMTLAEVASTFLDPAKTGRIVFQYGEMQDVFEGFTECREMGIDNDGRVSVCMVKGES